VSYCPFCVFIVLLGLDLLLM